MAAHPRVLVLALDAAEPKLLRRWSESGALPNLAALAKSGLSGETTNAPGLYTGTVWPSFHTGVEPGRHGRYFYRQLEPGTYKTKRFPAERLPVPSFWSVVGAAGRRVAVVDLPKAPLARGLSGLQLTDWGLHDPDGAVRSEPPALAREIVARFGTDPVGPCDLVGRDLDDVKELRDGLLARVQSKTEMIRQLLARDRWDLFLAAYGESHCAGHQFWSLHDPSHPRHQPRIARALGDPLREVYETIDAGIGSILDDLGPQTTVVVFASHGMGAHYDGTFMLEEILRRIEGAPPGPRRGRVERLRAIWHRMPIAVRSKLAPLADAAFFRLQSSGWSDRKCFIVPTNDNCAGIRINVVGREPMGIIRKGTEYEAYCGKLEKELRALVNVETGGPVVLEVLRAHEVFPGEHSGALPDLLVRWRRDSPIRIVRSPKIGTIEREYRGIRSGDHRNAGMFIARGPGIAPGRRLEPVSVTDFAPTLAKLAGVEMPGVDGKPIAELCRAS